MQRRGRGAERRLSAQGARRPAARDAEARDLARRPHRDPDRRQPVADRRGGARARPLAARDPRCDHDRQRHRARRRSVADLPPARARGALAGAGRARRPPAPAGDQPARRDRRQRADLADHAPARRPAGARPGLDRAGGRADRGGRRARRGPRPRGGRWRLWPRAGSPGCWSKAAPRLAASLLRRRLVDRLAWFQAPLVVGGDGLAAIAELGIDSLAAAVRCARESRRGAGAGHARGLYRLLRGRAMFTGIITDVGRIVEVAQEHGADQGRRLTIETRLPLAEIALGSSIATSGICFTAVDKGKGWFSVEASGATLEVTTAGALAAGRHGQSRALAADRRRDGRPHRVRPRRRGRRDRGARAGRRVAPPRGRRAGEPGAADRGQGLDRGRRHLAHGQSGERSGASPATSSRTAGAQTNLAERRPGDPVNVEVDMLARYVARQLAFRAQA